MTGLSMESSLGHDDLLSARRVVNTRAITVMRKVERNVDVAGRPRDAVGRYRLRPEQVPSEVLSLSERCERDDGVE